MADIKLYNKDGMPVTYEAITTVVLTDTTDQSVEFSIGGGVGGDIPGHIIQVGDTLGTIYFNTGYSFPQKGLNETITVLTAKKDDLNKLEIKWEHTFDGDIHGDVVEAIVTQNGDLISDVIYNGFAWVKSSIDVSAFDVGVVTAVDSIMVSINPIVAKDKISFGLFPALPPYLVSPGDTVNVLHFNPLSADAVTQLLPQLYAMSPKEVDADFGMSYTDLGLDMRIGDLSTVGLGSGYAIYSYSNKGSFLLFSTIAFDASAIVPGFVVTAPGWQVEYLEYKTPITANYDTIPWLVKTTGAMHMVWAKVPFSIDLSGIL